MNATIQNEIQQNGIGIVRTPTGIAVGAMTNFDDSSADRMLTIEVEYEGRLLKRDMVLQRNQLAPWRDYYAGLDMLKCVIRVKDGDTILAELGHPDAPMPFMVMQGEQRHITESYVSVPPALTITDEGGNVFTFGFERAPPERSPRGEFAFQVLKNGIGQGIIASRIERRNGKVRAFTKQGWKVWNGRFWF